MRNPVIVKLAENLTGRKCSRCAHNWRGKCVHRNPRMFSKCWQSITRPGFKKRPPRYLRDVTKLTAEEQHQLQKIKCTLDDAEEMARDSGLLED